MDQQGIWININFAYHPLHSDAHDAVRLQPAVRRGSIEARPHPPRLAAKPYGCPCKDRPIPARFNTPRSTREGTVDLCPLHSTSSGPRILPSTFSSPIAAWKLSTPVENTANTPPETCQITALVQFASLASFAPRESSRSLPCIGGEGLSKRARRHSGH